MEFVERISSTRYQIKRQMGSGSICLVYKALDLTNNKSVALKFLPPEMAEDLRNVEAMHEAFTYAQRVRHHNVLPTYEFIGQGNLVGYSMELADRGDLTRLMDPQNNAHPISRIIWILHQICLGLQAIHDADLIHRNLKPENILLLSDGTAKISDFRLACNREEQEHIETRGSEMAFGEIDYIPPEYLLREQIDLRADIYALGCLAYKLLTLQSPFVGESAYAAIIKRLKSNPPPPSSIRLDCPKQLDELVLRAMHRKPRERYQTANDMAVGLIDIFTFV